MSNQNRKQPTCENDEHDDVDKHDNRKCDGRFYGSLHIGAFDTQVEETAKSTWEQKKEKYKTKLIE